MNFSNVKMTVEHSGVRASVKIDKTPLVLGGISYAGGGLKSSITQLKKLKKRLESFIIHCNATFIPAPGETLRDWEIGFIQIVRWNNSRAVYGGRFPDEGSVFCEPTKSATSKIVVDSEIISTVPFYTFPDPVINTTMSVDTEDSPSHTVPFIVGNDAVGGVDNFLASYNDDMDFFTVLTVIEPSKALHFLAHIHWRVIFTGGLLWRFGDPLVSDRSSINFDLMIAGEPSDAAVSAILKSPAGPIANDLFVRVYNNSFISGAHADPDTHLSSPTRDFFIPQIFWE